MKAPATVAPQATTAAATLWRCGGRTCGAGECEHDDDALHRHVEGAGSADTLSRYRVSHPDDPAEREADLTADRIIGGSPVTVSGDLGSVGVHRKGLADMSELEDDELLRSATQTTSPTARADDRGIDSVRSGGTAMDPASRAFMEQRFGHDFGSVRLHTDSDAGRAARSVSARAFTVGNHIAFAPGEYQPHSQRGQRLLAHELTHVVQQGAAAASPSGGIVARDLATAPPAEAAAEQADLTEDQIRAAISFNRNRYNAQSTRLIQDLVGTTVTGTWTREDVVAVAALQEEFGMTADGKVGSETFRWLNSEQTAEGVDTTSANCLTAFNVSVAPVRFVGTNPATIEGHFRTASEFSGRCRCSEFQYRQFIRGHARRTRGGVTTDLASVFSRIPGGQLPANFVEDGDTSDNPVNYGHRNNPADTTPEDHYINDRNQDDQANGCRYRNEDFPGLTGITNIQTGDVFDLNISFRGEIQRNGRAVQTRQWSAINGRFTIP